MADWVDAYHELATFDTEGVSMGCKVTTSPLLKPNELALVDFEVAVDGDGNFLYTTMVPKKVKDG